MPTIPTLPCVLAAATTLLAALAPAQVHAGEFSPNPVQPGQTVTFTMTDSTGQGRNLPSPCTWYTIHSGSQAGPVVGTGVGCPAVIVPLAPNGSRTFAWNQLDQNGRQVPPDQYWIEVRSWDQGFGSLAIDWFCLSIQAAADPALTAQAPTVIGTNVPLLVQAPQLPGAFWFCAASLSANNPVSVLGLDLCLSQPITAAPLLGAFGQLDAQGNSSGLALALPNLPWLRFQGLQLQALIVPASGPFAVTNGVAVTIR